MTLEKMEKIVKEITLDFYNGLEEEYGVEFTTEEVQAAIRSHQDTIDFENEKNFTAEGFEDLYCAWIEDAKYEVLSMKLEKKEKKMALAELKEKVENLDKKGNLNIFDMTEGEYGKEKHLDRLEILNRFMAEEELKQKIKETTFLLEKAKETKTYFETLLESLLDEKEKRENEKL